MSDLAASAVGEVGQVGDESADAPTESEQEPIPGVRLLLSLRNRQAVEVELGRLVFDESPQLSGEDVKHIRPLVDSEQDLAPILVCVPTPPVPDRRHRVHTALRTGNSEIGAYPIDCDEASTRVPAVTANIGHGLPLSRDHRHEAARAILETHATRPTGRSRSPSGLSDKTVTPAPVFSTFRHPEVAQETRQNIRARRRFSAGTLS